MATLNRVWAGFGNPDFNLMTTDIPESTELHQLIQAAITPTVLQSLDAEQTGLGPPTGLFDIITDIALTGPQITAVDAILAAHTGTPIGEPAGDDTVLTVPSVVAVGNLVYLTGLDTADRADNGNGTTGSAVGVVTSKPTETTARVKTSGEVGGLTGMTPGAMQFLGTNGGRVEAGGLPSATGEVWQELGVAVSSTVILLDIERPTVLS